MSMMAQKFAKLESLIGKLEGAIERGNVPAMQRYLDLVNDEAEATGYYNQKRVDVLFNKAVQARDALTLS